ncbi:Uncharacterized protein AMR50_1405 [Leptospira interrogans]|nr:Uncharacterized protein AMR50_1405 [Leptospira interrogans]
MNIKTKTFAFIFISYTKMNFYEIILYFILLRKHKVLFRRFITRSTFQIASLSLNSPVRIKINWKSDFSFSQGKERQFYELDYIVEFKGIFETFLRENPKTETFLKYIQISNCKEIDLRKILNEYVFDAKKLDFLK